MLTSAINGYLADPTVSQSNQILATNLLTLLGTQPIGASEIVKVSYNGGSSQLLYGFSATQSGLVSADDHVSHIGNYEVTIQDTSPTSPLQIATSSLQIPTSSLLHSAPLLRSSTPEPSALLGLLGVVGVFAAQRRLKGASRRSCALPETKVSG